MSAADGVDARARRVAARLLSSRSRRAAPPGSAYRHGNLPDTGGRWGGTGHPAGAARLARALAALADDGWLAFPQVPQPGSRDGRRIDHLVIGPGGVVVVDSRPWVGRIEVSRGVVQQNGFWREHETAAVARTAGSVSALLPPRHRTAVHAFVCIAQHDLPEQVVAPGVHVVGVTGLGRALRSLPPRLDPDQVHEVATLLRQALDHGQGPEQLTTAELDASPPGEQPPGAHRDPASAARALPGARTGLFVPASAPALRSAARRRRPARPGWRSPRVLVPRVLLAGLLLAGALLVGSGLLRALGGIVDGGPQPVAPAATSTAPAGAPLDASGPGAGAVGDPPLDGPAR